MAEAKKETDRWLVEVDDQGLVRPVGRRAARQLRARVGRWRLVPSPDELVVLQRVDPMADQGGGRKVGRVVLTGVIASSTDVVDVLNYVYTNQKSGVLVVVSGEVKKSLFFKQGDVRMATSNQEEDKLGSVLYRYGYLSREQLEEVLQGTQGKRLGQALVDAGLITVHDLYVAVRRQIEDIFYSVLMFREGVFYFYTLQQDSALPATISLGTHALIMEGVRRIDEMSFFREKIPSPELVVEVSPDAPPRNLDEKESMVYCLIDGRRSIRDLARESRFGEFEVTKIIFHLLQMRYVRVRQEDEAVHGLKPSAKVQAAAEVVETFNQVFRKIFAEVAERGRLDSVMKGIGSFFDNPGEFDRLFDDVHFLRDGSLPVERIAANLEALDVPKKSDYLYQALNELLFFVMFNAGQALSEEDEQQLHSKLNEIFAKLGG